MQLLQVTGQLASLAPVASDDRPEILSLEAEGERPLRQPLHQLSRCWHQTAGAQLRGPCCSEAARTPGHADWQVITASAGGGSSQPLRSTRCHLWQLGQVSGTSTLRRFTGSIGPTSC